MNDMYVTFFQQGRQLPQKDVQEDMHVCVYAFHTQRCESYPFLPLTLFYPLGKIQIQLLL